MAMSKEFWHVSMRLRVGLEQKRLKTSFGVWLNRTCQKKNGRLHTSDDGPGSHTCTDQSPIACIAHSLKDVKKTYESAG